MNFDQKTLLPTDMPDVQLLMWSYADPQAGMVGYGTITALAQAFDDAAHYGDGEDMNPKDVWAITTHGPVKAILSTVREDTMVKVWVKWLRRTAGQSGSTVMNLRAWYPVRDI